MSKPHEPDNALWEATNAVLLANYEHIKTLYAYQDVLTKKIDELQSAHIDTRGLEYTRLKIAMEIVSLNEMSRVLLQHVQIPFANQVQPLHLVQKT